MKKYWYLFWHLRKLHLMRQLEFRGDFFFWASVSAMWTIFNFFFFALIVGVTGSIGGWSIYEIYILLSVFTMMDAFIWSFFYHNMRNYSLAVFDGRLNYILTRPIDAQFLIMTETNNYTNIFRLFMGGGMLWWSIRQLDISIMWWQWILFLGLFWCALLLVYFIWFMLSTGAFWVEKLDNINEIIPSARRILQVPRSIYTGVAGFFVMLVVPISLVSSVPSEVLIGRFNWQWSLYLVFSTIIAYILSRWFFTISVKRYTGIAN